MRDVAVVGVHMLKFGRYPDKDVVQLASETTIAALKDAGCSINDIELVASGNLYQSNAMIGQRVMKEIGATGIPVINVANACATGSTAFREAYYSVASGAYDTALAVGSEQMGKMGLLGAGGGGDRAYSTEGIMGTGLMPGVFGQAGVEHMRKYGTTQEQIAKIAVKNHEHGVLNPNAQYRKETPLEDVLNARVIAWPNTLYMCCPTGDGASAAVLMSAEKAKKYTSKPVWVAASILTSDPYQERNPTMFDINTVTRNAAKQAYDTAGIGPEDLDMVELHDCFATAELLHYENLGLCADGEAGKLIDDKETYNGGKIPVNVSGGLLSKGHPLGATGVANITEIVWHLREEAGDRQVKGAKTGLAHVIGLGSACTINVLKR
ncbi:MAG: thiolase family protein [Chloroflexi bacterium]|nr:thiolase family protein [Chloroflexota bacterium]MCI0783007.1 thiolase family protein [Chloroflexota bacterium]MCI0814053.1 thiolase family protein [Chloroflexota bacterium]MCI0817462.1 thiolase family protein [Chloroflexota bacterium]MCI0819163.1 thiolase family protein [Chloroflexota bacterium]